MGIGQCSPKHLRYQRDIQMIDLAPARDARAKKCLFINSVDMQPQTPKNRHLDHWEISLRRI